MITLFRCTTGESWNGLMHELMFEQPALSPLFFISFTILGSFVLLNLIIAVILDNFSAITQANKGGIGISSRQIESFRAQWTRLSRGRPFIPVSKLAWLLNRLPPPMGFKGLVVTGNDTGGLRLIRYIQELDMQCHPHPDVVEGRGRLGVTAMDGGGVAYYIETLVAITSTLYSERDKILTAEAQMVRAELFRDLHQKLVLDGDHTDDRPVVDVYAALKLAKVVKRFLVRWRAARAARASGGTGARAGSPSSRPVGIDSMSRLAVLAAGQPTVGGGAMEIAMSGASSGASSGVSSRATSGASSRISGDSRALSRVSSDGQRSPRMVSTRRLGRTKSSAPKSPKSPKTTTRGNGGRVESSESADRCNTGRHTAIELRPMTSHSAGNGGTGGEGAGKGSQGDGNGIDQPVPQMETNPLAQAREGDLKRHSSRLRRVTSGPD